VGHVSDRLRVLALACVLASASVSIGAKKAHEAPKAALPTPADLIDLMKASKVRYMVRSLSALEDVPASEFSDRLWPPQGKPLALPYIETGAGGKASLVSYPVSDEGIRALSAADGLYQKKDYNAAQTAYADVVQRFPDFYRAHLYLGDALFEKGDNVAALAAYREGIRLNPFDYVGHLFAGHALVKLGRKDEALDAWVRALSLRAYQDTTLKLAQRYAEELGITVHGERFEPRAFVRREGKEVTLYLEPTVHWMSWANCKAVWLAEPEYRSSRGVEGENLWASTEDRECLVHLLVMYGESLKDGKTPAEPQLDRLYPLLEDHLLSEYVVYEFGTRVAPDTLLLVDVSKFRMEEFVRRYILPKGHTATPP
jgi:tetratricopeptide (TPR) repeat protein